MSNDNILTLDNMHLKIPTLANMPGFIEKSKVPFNSVENLIVNRHLYLGFENNKREEVISVCDFVSGELSEDNNNDSEVAQETVDNKVKLKDNTLDGKFGSKNITNLSQRQLKKVRNFASFRRT